MSPVAERPSTPASRGEWRAVLDLDPEAMASQAPEWLDALASRGYANASRAYTLADGRRAVLPMAGRTRLGVALGEES
jgi:hypothetical protein